nr:PREDICTED: nuclear factor 7, brain-like [Latimeria chalumnae]|eukprot:XP_006011877.1 PREDICTED: nuclear factor 7, brain-like [Latimeria chalumnae]
MKWKVKEGANSISIMTVVAKRLKIELSCSLCLDLYTDPVLLDCDHNFCQKCISKVEEGVDGSVKCPQCWQVIRTRRFRVNRSLANIMESYKGAQGDSRLYCEEHGAKLQLFCKEEQKVIGLVCGVSEHHRDHQHTPIAEAVEPYKKKLEASLKALQEAETEAKRCLNEEKEDIKKLQDIKATLDRTEVKFIKPERHSMDLCEGQVIGPLQYKVWKRMRECIIPALESITIDPATAHKHLTVSRDWSSVKHGLMQQDLPDGLERFKSSFAALGSKGFTSGRHYWEVEVGDKAFWILGVAKESVERKEYFSHTDQNGVWVLCLRNGHNYVICTSPVKTLPVHVELRKIRVLLDFEGGQVSFYSADDMSHIYTYTDTFTERIYPFFNPYCNLAEEANKPLRILPL